MRGCRGTMAGTGAGVGVGAGALAGSGVGLALLLALAAAAPFVDAAFFFLFFFFFPADGAGSGAAAGGSATGSGSGAGAGSGAAAGAGAAAGGFFLVFLRFRFFAAPPVVVSALEAGAFWLLMPLLEGDSSFLLNPPTRNRVIKTPTPIATRCVTKSDMLFPRKIQTPKTGNSCDCDCDCDCCCCCYCCCYCYQNSLGDGRFCRCSSRCGPRRVGCGGSIRGG
mmetsp:Transcript_8912/g.26487  ORF Transcript_8912/g.26487 Transcript_8912/m.26487 type:complete len:223 (+) Transcript_8912:1229-1897(+)